MALKDDLVSVWEMDEASGNALDSHGSEYLTDTDTCGADTGVINGCRTFNGSSEYFVRSDNSALSREGKDWSMILWANSDDGVYNLCSKIGSFPNFEFGIRRKFTGTANRMCLEIWDNGGGTTDIFAESYGALPSSTWIMVFVSYKASNGAAAISINAGAQDTTTMGSGIISAGNADFHLGKYRTDYFAGKLDQVALWDRVITQDEIEEIYNSGNGLAYSEWDAGDSVTVTPDTASLSLTGYAPTVSTPRVVTPGVASLSLTGYAPTVSTPRVATPSPATLTTTGYAPTVSTPRLVTPGVASLSLTSYAPTVSTPRLVTPGVASLTISAFAPTVSTPRTVTPGVLSLVLTAYAPVVSGGGDVTVTPGNATLTISAFAPTVSTPRLVTPGVLTLAITGFAPSVFLGTISTPGAAALAITAYAPTVSTPRVVIPSTRALALTMFAASVSTGGDDVLVLPALAVDPRRPGFTVNPARAAIVTWGPP